MVLNRWLPSEMRFLITIPSLRLIVFGLATVLVATLSWRFLEQPINRLRGEKTGELDRRDPLSVMPDSEAEASVFRSSANSCRGR